MQSQQNSLISQRIMQLVGCAIEPVNHNLDAFFWPATTEIIDKKKNIKKQLQEKAKQKDGTSKSWNLILQFVWQPW